MFLSNETKTYAEEAKNLRRSLHRIPEKGLEEYKTQRFILEYLQKLGVPATTMAGTGVKAIITGALPGPVTALRADMDALNVDEQTACGFESDHSGWMHACGHDGHMAALLATANLLLANKVRMKGTAVLLFQPSEETVKGAAMMIDEGALQNPAVERIFAFHLMPHIDEGKIGIVSGPAMAAACEFEIEVHGKSAHGAMPHVAVDAIAAAAQFVSNVQAVISRNKPPEAPGLLTIGRFEGGRRHNIIAVRVEMEGTLRSYDDAVMQSMKDRLLAHLKGIEQAWGVTTNFREMSVVPVTSNNADLAQVVTATFPEACIPTPPLMVAEDFSRYGHEVPAFMGLLGCRCETSGYTEPLHSARFNYNEHALLYALEFYKRLFID
jgi:amidohydrolase